MIYAVILFIALLTSACANIFLLLYSKRNKELIKELNLEIKSKDIAIGYAEYGLDISNEKIVVLKKEIKKLLEENRLLNAKINKINNQFKNVKDYLSKN